MKRLILTLSILLSGALVAHAGSVRVDTLAPAPAGNFTSMKLQPATLPGTCTPGTIVVGADNMIHFCVNEGGVNVWRVVSPFVQNGNDIYLTSDTPGDDFVGLGTNNPEFKMDLRGNGSIIATGTYAGSDAALTTAGAGTRFIWWTTKAALRAGGVSGTQWDTTNIGNYSAALGYNNQASATGSSILGGSTNTVAATSLHSTIAGGLSNSVADVNTPLVGYSFIGGGRENVLDGSYEFIGGGFQNTIGTGTIYNTIGGGYSNFIPANSTANTIAGGYNNYAAGLGGSTVGGGAENDVAGGLGYATVAGGYNNDIVAGDSSYSTISGGNANLVRGQYNTVSGGDQNNVDAVWATIGGGVQNSISSGLYNTIGGGSQNSATNSDPFKGGSTVGGGVNNSATVDYAFVGGGRNNTASAESAVVVGGGGFDPLGPTSFGNQATALASFVGGGQNNIAAQTYATVTGGQTNSASGTHSSVSGGQSNTASGSHSVVIGGQGNTAGAIYSVASGHNTSVQGDKSFAGGEGITLSASADRTFAWGHATTTVNTPDAFLILTGNVGVGIPAPTQQVHISQALRLDPLDSAPGACDSTQTGSMYMSSTGNYGNPTLCLCNGTDWIDVVNTNEAIGFYEVCP